MTDYADRVPAPRPDETGKHPRKATPPPGGWPTGGTQVAGWHLCAACGDSIYPGEHVYDNGGNTVRCAVCEIARRVATTTPTRPVPTLAARLTDARLCGHTPEQHRHDDGQAADARSQDRAMRELTAELAEERATHKATLGLLLRAEEREVRLRDEMGAAGEVIAVVRDAQEQIERALARYDTTPQAPLKHVSVLANCISCGAECPNGRCPNDTPAAGLGSASPRAQEQPEREETRWAYRWIGTDGQVYDEMDASDNAIETGEQRAHRIAAKRLTGTVRGEVVRYRVLTMPAEVVATYPAEEPA